MMQISQTSEYDRFQLHPVNRELRRVEILISSMKRYGWIDAYPMNVSHDSEGGLLIIKDGHHRFEAAKTLGLEVKYVICSDNADIYDLATSTTPWNLKDFLGSRCQNGNPDYRFVQTYALRTGIPIAACIAILGGQTADSHNKLAQFKRGTFVLAADITHAIEIEDLVGYCKANGIGWANTATFVSALSHVLWVKEFLPSEFKKKVAAHSFMMTRSKLKEGYVKAIEAVYNRQRQGKLPIEFMANEAAKRRQQRHFALKQIRQRIEDEDI
jgi:hypothetical protein